MQNSPETPVISPGPTPSPCTRGEGRGEGDFEYKTAGDIQNHPQSHPLPEHRAKAQKRFGIIITVFILLSSTVLLFAHLGRYAPWDDEALTIMTARSVWRTGDTSAWSDDLRNLAAYRDGLLIRNFKDRYTSPLQFYLMAPVVGVLGPTNFAARLPFALCGLISIAILLRWLWRVNPSPTVWSIAAVAILTNAELFLFFRQARYYGLATVLTVAVGYAYWFLTPRRRSVWALSLLLVLLLTAQYLNYAAAIACLVMDYTVWGRKRRPLDRWDWLILLLPQLIVCTFVCSIWNPLAVKTNVYQTQHWLPYHTILTWWDTRDLIASDFLSLPLLVLCPVLYFLRRNLALLRAPAALAVYVLAISAFAATPLEKAGNAEVRYLAPALPLCIGIEILAVWAFEKSSARLRTTIVLLAILTMLIEPAGVNGDLGMNSTALAFYHELYSPQVEPYTPTIDWINNHVPAGSSIFVQPTWMMYPLMLKAPNAVYAWQLNDPPTSPEYRGLPDIFFTNRIPPDYLIAFGPFKKEMGQTMDALEDRGIDYRLVDTIHVYWKDLYRPERIWRSFKTTPPEPGAEIYIYKKSS